MTRGATLLELLLVLAIMSLLALLAYPRIEAQRDRLAVEHQASAIVAAHREARMAALTWNRRAELIIHPDSLAVQTIAGPDTQVVWVRPGPSTDQVTITGSSLPIEFAPNGLSMAFSNRRYVLSKGSVSRQVVTSRPGRIKVLP